MSGIGLQGSDGLVLTGVGGIALVGNALFRYTDFRSTFTRTFHKGRGGIAWGDVLTPYVASLTTGKSDFEALRLWFGQTWVARALRIDAWPRRKRSISTSTIWPTATWRSRCG